MSEEHASAAAEPLLEDAAIENLTISEQHATNHHDDVPIKQSNWVPPPEFPTSQVAEDQTGDREESSIAEDGDLIMMNKTENEFDDIPIQKSKWVPPPEFAEPVDIPNRNKYTLEDVPKDMNDEKSDPNLHDDNCIIEAKDSLEDLTSKEINEKISSEFENRIVDNHFDEASIKKSNWQAPPEFPDDKIISTVDELPIKKKSDWKPPPEFPSNEPSSTIESKKVAISGNSNAPSEFPEVEVAKPILVQKEKPYHPVVLKTEEHMPYEDSLKILPGLMTSKILSKNFRERVEGFTLLKESIESAESSEISASAVFIFLSKGGFKDSNAMATSKMYETLSSACAWTKTFSVSLAELVFPQCLISLADSKALPPINNFLLELAECIGADNVQALILKHLENIKSPKSIQFALCFLTELLKQFGAKEFGLVPIIDSIKKFLNFAQGTVRQAATDFFAELSLQTGRKYEERLLDGLNTSLSTALKSKLKESADSDYQPVRKNRIKDDNISSKGPAKSKRTGVDISKEISVSLSTISDSNWKLRKESLESVEKIFSMSGGDCELNSDLQSNLFQSIAQRLKDSNKNIIGLALKLALKVAENLGNPDRSRVGVLIDALCQTVGDSKKAISQAAEDALLLWVKNDACFSVFCQKFEKSTKVAGAKASLLNILKVGFSTHPESEFEGLLPSVLLLLNDKNKDARSNADLVIDCLLSKISFEQILSAMKGFLPQEQIVIRGIVEKKGLKAVQESSKEEKKPDLNSKPVAVSKTPKRIAKPAKQLEVPKSALKPSSNAIQEISNEASNSQKSAAIGNQRPTISTQLPSKSKASALSPREVKPSKFTKLLERGSAPCADQKTELSPALKAQKTPLKADKRGNAVSSSKKISASLSADESLMKSRMLHFDSIEANCENNEAKLDSFSRSEEDAPIRTIDLNEQRALFGSLFEQSIIFGKLEMKKAFLRQMYRVITDAEMYEKYRSEINPSAVLKALANMV
jgi:hypothetical protein